ncbi:hypothetical protein [Denitromonas halophila]|uniref:Uncharacterized protein n=1 Tax=Denitromonas halophila TaxID=1629404 RepID=A0A557QXA0_9RHOO|nr:hypothetical protein [Denitromonas halophila]TVO57531.1 hypothetical protein FHP91_07595 [Denitromonas halophila]
MTPQEIRDAIAADPTLIALRDAGNFAAIAAALPAERVPQTTLGGVGAVMEALGPVAGAEVLDALDALKASISAVKWAWVLINRGELDFGSASTRGMIQQLGQMGVFSNITGLGAQQVVDALLGIGDVSRSTTSIDVRKALLNSDGSAA